MHKKIYFGNNPLFLSDALTAEMKPYADDSSTLVLQNPGAEAVNEAIRQLQGTAPRAAILLHSSPDELWRSLTQQRPLIQAAGGLVHSDENHILLIFRRKKWDLPKGKLDEGEALDACALREVQEETGMEQISLERPLCITYHAYFDPWQQREVLKESHWYLMRTPHDQVLTPQTEEDIEKCEWVKPSELGPYLENTFPSIVDVLKTAAPLLEPKK
ncbi:NUDIX domain-containing protein [Paraflavisolibacter sp. H34]|uniref:NUDIX hydrolase n=1 Tax=Huijunlia imazamoxiresistens TaxID=3127457 RepID=UPI0030170C13